MAGREEPSAQATARPSGVDPASDTGTFHFTDLDATAEFPLVAAPPPAGGRRKATRGARRVPGLPSAPILVGVATLAVAVGGALTAQNAGAEHASAAPSSDPSITGTVNKVRSSGLSRDADRNTAQDALVAAAEEQAGERNELLGKLAKRAEQQAQTIEDNLWVLPLRPSIITGTFGATSIWSGGHSGLDFNGETGEPIHSIAGGVVTYTGYAGNCGYRTEVVLPDNTALVYCHQSEILVSVGDQVTRDQIIGLVGTTGRSTGSHLHVEVHPDGGHSVDPYPWFVEHGVTP